jgi:hypothetical protein
MDLFQFFESAPIKIPKPFHSQFIFMFQRHVGELLILPKETLGNISPHRILSKQRTNLSKKYLLFITLCRIGSFFKIYETKFADSVFYLVLCIILIETGLPIEE